VKIAPPSDHGNTPYTVQSGGCGAPGEYIHYTPEYIKTSTQPDNIETFGIPGIIILKIYVRCWYSFCNKIKIENIFVHEWAQLRYGVFDEHGYPGDENYPVFQTVISTEPIPNICTNEFPIFDMK